MDEEAQQDETSEHLGSRPGHIPEVRQRFDEAMWEATVKTANPQNAAGPSGLRYSHLHAVLSDSLIEKIE